MRGEGGSNPQPRGIDGDRDFAAVAAGAAAGWIGAANPPGGIGRGDAITPCPCGNGTCHQRTDEGERSGTGQEAERGRPDADARRRRHAAVDRRRDAAAARRMGIRPDSSGGTGGHRAAAAKGGPHAAHSVEHLREKEPGPSRFRERPLSAVRMAAAAPSGAKRPAGAGVGFDAVRRCAGNAARSTLSQGPVRAGAAAAPRPQAA